MTGRFQEFAPEWRQGVYETPLVDLESIDQVPITMFIAPDDQICTMENAFKEGARIPSVVDQIIVEDADHNYFAYLAHDEWFVSNLIEQM